MVQRGYFLALEGIDGSGTTTQAQRLQMFLESQGHRAHITRQPSDGPIGKMIRGLLAKKEGQPVNWEMLALLFAADRLRHWQEEVEPLLAQGVFVICDRYVLSSLVYQGQDCPEEWVREINRYAATPDLTLLVAIDAQRAYERVQSRGGTVEIYDELEKQKSLAQRYARLGQQEKVHFVEGDQSIDAVAQQIQLALKPLLESR
jgi:dTMP kinase